MTITTIIPEAASISAPAAFWLRLTR